MHSLQIVQWKQPRTKTVIIHAKHSQENSDALQQ